MNVNTKHAEPVGAVVLRFAERMSLGALPGSFAACAAEDARAMQSELAASRAQVATLREALEWALSYAGEPVQRIKGQNDAYCDAYAKARAALAATEAQEGGAL